jgi:hypothetical protein
MYPSRTRAVLSGLETRQRIRLELKVAEAEELEPVTSGDFAKARSDRSRPAAVRES